MDTIWFDVLSETPLGKVWVAVSSRGLGAVYMGTSRQGFEAEVQRRYGEVLLQQSPQRTAETVQQIRAYLNGQRREFSMPIDWEGLGNFQRRALQATYAIPYGETRTYGEIAALLGNPKAARAVGRAEATNPMPLVVPCHRVLGSDGKLHGYGGGEGLPTKAWLLQLEAGAVVQS